MSFDKILIRFSSKLTSTIFHIKILLKIMLCALHFIFKSTCSKTEKLCHSTQCCFILFVNWWQRTILSCNFFLFQKAKLCHNWIELTRMIQAVNRGYRRRIFSMFLEKVYLFSRESKKTFKLLVNKPFFEQKIILLFFRVALKLYITTIKFTQ